MDISVRIPKNSFRIQYLEDNCVEKKQLSDLKDIMFKPVGVDLSNYNPSEICLRLRKFSDLSSSLTEIRSIKKKTGYSDERKLYGKGDFKSLKTIAANMGYEIWGEMLVNSTEYMMRINGELVSAFCQKIIPIGEFIKIETSDMRTINLLLNSLKVSDDERIEKNSAVLLAERMGLIS